MKVIDMTEGPDSISPLIYSLLVTAVRKLGGKMVVSKEEFLTAVHSFDYDIQQDGAGNLVVTAEKKE